MFEPLRSTTKRVVLRCLILSVPVCVNVFKTFFSTNHPVCRAISTTLHTIFNTVPHPLMVTTSTVGGVIDCIIFSTVWSLRTVNSKAITAAEIQTLNTALPVSEGAISIMTSCLRRRNTSHANNKGALFSSCILYTKE